MTYLQQQIVDRAREWADKAVPYLHRGHSEAGVDCSGLLVGIIQSLGYLKDFEMPLYPFDWNLHDCKHNFLLEYLPVYCVKVSILDMDPGDILLFRFGKQVSHAGILLNDKDGLFVHCYYPRGTGYATLQSMKWGSRLVEVWRIDEAKLT